MRELNVASLEGKPILPMRLDNAKVSNKDRLLMGFEQRVEASSRPLSGEVYRRLLGATGRILNNAESPEHPK